jgi:PAS domain S-box-containing protein
MNLMRCRNAGFGFFVFRRIDMTHKDKTKEELIEEVNLLQQLIVKLEEVKEECQKTQDFLNEVESIAKIGGWKMDLITRKATWTQGTYDIVEIAPGEPIPGPDEHVSYYLPEYRLLVAEAMRALIEEDKPLDFEAPLRTAKGNIKWCRAIGRVRREGGKAVEVYGTFQDITERKKVEDRLKKSEERYRELVEGSNSAIIRWKNDGTIAFFNEYAQKFFGYAMDEVIGKHVSILVPKIESTGRDLSMMIQDIVDHPDRYISNINENIRRDGSRVWLAWTNRAILDGDGQIVEILAIGSDITERKEAEEALISSEKQYKALFERIKDPVFIADPQTRMLVDCNIAAVNMTGYSKEEILSMRADQLHTKEALDKTVEAFKRQATGEDVVVESEVLTKAGQRIPVSISSGVVELKGKTHLIGLFKDVAVYKKAEDDIRSSHNLLQKIINLLPIRIFWKDKNLRFLGCNEIFAKDAGKERPEDLIGKDDFQMAWKEQAKIYQNDDQAVIKSGKPKLNFEEPQTTPKGDEIWLKTSKVPLVYSQVNEIGVLGTYEDITERKRLEEEMKKRLQELEVFYKASLGREERILELKKEIEKLKKELGK